MRKLLLCALALGVYSTGFGQALAPQKGKFSAKQAFDRNAQLVTEDVMSLERNMRTSQEAQPEGYRPQLDFVTGSEFGDMIGFTYYDNHAWGSMTSAIVNQANNKIAVVWTYGRQALRAGRMTGYNERVNGVWRWNTSITSPGDPADSLNYNPQGPNRAYTGGTFENTRIGWPNLIHDNGAGTSIIPYAFFPNDPSGLTKQWAFVQNATGSFDTLNRYTSGAINREAVFHVTASGDNMQYLVTSTTDTTNLPDIAGWGVSNPIVLYRSNNVGRTWSVQFLPFMNPSARIGGIKRSSIAMDAKGSYVAIAANATTFSPEAGIATVLFKSNNFGAAGSWEMKVIQKRTTADTNNAAGNYTIGSDGCLAVTIDNSNNVHVASGNGFQTIDSAGTATNTFYIGGAINPVFGRILYWNELLGEGAGFQEIAAPVDVDRSGTITFPGTQDPKRHGLYPVGPLSHPNIAVDAENNVYVTYTGVVEGTEQLANPRVTRDIYVVASYDGGRTFTNPINLAGRALAVAPNQCFTFDDGTSGSGAYEEANVVTVKRIGADNLLHMTWMSDDKAGLAEASGGANPTIAVLQGYPVGSWAPNAINYAGVPLANLKAQFATAIFPKVACSAETFTINLRMPRGTACMMDEITPATIWTAQVDTSRAGVFANPISVGTYTGNTDGNITAVMPTLNPGQNKYSKIRVVANNGNPSALPPKYQTMTSEYYIDLNNGTPPAPTISAAFSSAGGSIADNSTHCNTISATFLASGSALTSEFVYTITPANAGTVYRVDGTPGQANIVFNSNYEGPVTISVRATNGCGSSPEVSRTFSLGGPLVTRTGNSLTSATTGGQWQYSSTPNGPWSALLPPVTAATIDLNARPNGYYRYLAGCPSNVFFWNLASLVSEAKTQFSLYPNPAQGFAIVELANNATAQNIEITLTDMAGRTVKTETLSASGEQTQHRLDLSKLQKGIYLVRVNQGDAAASVKRLVVE